MTVTHSDYTEETTGSTVTAAFAGQVKGKTIVVTGVNAGGIGGATVRALAGQEPKLIIAAGRSTERIDAFLADLRKEHPSANVRSLKLELSSLKSAKEAADKILSDDEVSQIDIVINNAGIMNIETRTLSEDGIELQFATNHVGHFRFTTLIMPKILAAAKTAKPGATRIVNVSSLGMVYSPIRFSDWNFNKKVDELPEGERPDLERLRTYHPAADESISYSGMVAYGQSKTANVLFSVGINERYYEKDGVLSIAIHPGVIMTELARNMDRQVIETTIQKMRDAGRFIKDLSQGASTQLVAALDPALTPEDAYLSDCQKFPGVPAYALDKSKANQLWELTEELVAVKRL